MAAVHGSPALAFTSQFTATTFHDLAVDPVTGRVALRE